MALSIGLPTSFTAVSTTVETSASSSSLAVKPSSDAVPVQGSDEAAGSASSQKTSHSGLGKVVDTLLDRLAELHERLQRLRQELRDAANSSQPDEVRLPRILSLQREIMITNGDIQLVSGLLVTTLNKTPGVHTQA